MEEIELHSIEELQHFLATQKSTLVHLKVVPSVSKSDTKVETENSVSKSDTKTELKNPVSESDTEEK
ncbi:MAG: hypothetical protein PUF78_03280 [Lachnospiraceae bacterium]|nr:hypothetical protein [Lachnospiraceae bacterium]